MALTLVATSTSDEQLSCLDLSYCNLLKGDIARESVNLSRDPSKFYRAAEEGIELYKKYNQKPDDSVKEECARLFGICVAEEAEMAAVELDFPKQYQKVCNYESHSRTIFDCKNIKSWPEGVKEYLPISMKSCSTYCVITEDTKYKLTTGKIVNYLYTGAQPSGEPEIDGTGIEVREINSKRSISVQITAFDDDLNKTEGWGVLDTCPKDFWVTKVDKIVRGDYLFFVSFGCGKFGKEVSQTRFIESTVVGKKPINGSWGPEYEKTLNKHCNDIKPSTYGKSFMTGISISTKQFRAYGKIPLYINFLCANTGWTYPRENGNIPTAIPDSKELICPNDTAICSVQTRSDTFEDIRFLIDIRIGCCYKGSHARKLFQKKEPSPTPTTVAPSMPTLSEGLLKLQTQSSYFIFWDESEVLNDIITRYNIYYTPAKMIDDDIFEPKTCKPGEFLSSFELRDPKSCYFQGRRIPEILFNCTTKDGKERDILDMYTRLKTGHTLQDSKFFDSKDCNGGHYTGMKFTYYVNKEYPYMVNAWAVKMKCSIGANHTDHESVMKAYGGLDLAAHATQEGTVNCGEGKAICGFHIKMSENQTGTFEGFYFKVVCCNT